LRPTSSPIVSNVSRIISKTVDPEDGRKTLYPLTPRGIDLAPVLVERVVWSARYDKTDVPPAIVRKNRDRFIAGVRKASLRHDP
jgi:DNA-binding HxlR family transcriptional regulator